MLQRTHHRMRIMEAIDNNRKRHDEVTAMHLPYGSHCRAWVNMWLDQQLQVLLNLLKEVPSA